MMNVYAAGPITGLNYKGATDWRQYTQGLFDRMSGQITVLDPMRGKAFLRSEIEIGSGGYDNQVASEKGITNRDRRDVMNSDAVIVNLVGAGIVSIGTMIELGWADAARIPIVLVMEEFHNKHDHAMVREVATYRVQSVERAVELVTLMLDPRGMDTPVPPLEELNVWQDGWQAGWDEGYITGGGKESEIPK